VTGRVRKASVTGSDDLLDIVHRRDGLLRIFLIGVSHEPKPPTTAGVAVLDNNLVSTMLGSAHNILLQSGARELGLPERWLRNEVGAK